MKCKTTGGGWVVFSGVREVERKKLPVPPFSCVALPARGPQGLFQTETNKQRTSGKKSCSVTLLLCPPQYIRENRSQEWIWQPTGQGWIQDLFMLGATSLQSCPILLDRMDCSPPGSSVLVWSRQEYWSSLQSPPSRDLPNPGVKPTSLLSPASAGRFFTTSTTWGAQVYLNL